MQKEVYRMYVSGFITRDSIAEYRDLKMESEEDTPAVKPKVKKVSNKIKWKDTFTEAQYDEWFKSYAFNNVFSKSKNADAVFKITIEEI